MSPSSPLRVQGTEGDPSRDYGSDQTSVYGDYGTDQTSVYGDYGTDQTSVYGVLENRPDLAAVCSVKADIDSVIRDLRAWHRTISDGIALAAEQVQDKRIDWLEEGPEVEVEVSPGFCISVFSRFARICEVANGITQAFGYARNREVTLRLTRRTAAFERIESKEAGKIAAAAPVLHRPDQLTEKIGYAECRYRPAGEF